MMDCTSNIMLLLLLLLSAPVMYGRQDNKLVTPANLHGGKSLDRLNTAVLGIGFLT